MLKSGNKDQIRRAAGTEGGRGTGGRHRNKTCFINSLPVTACPTDLQNLAHNSFKIPQSFVILVFLVNLLDYRGN